MPADPSPPPPREPAIRLAASLDIAAAQDLLAQVRGALPRGALVLDGSAVERVSVPCLQILAAARQAAAGGAAFNLVDASPALAAAVADLGLTAAIPLES